MNVKEIVADYLAANGYDGLVNPDTGCGCDLEDLIACGSVWETSCKPGYKIPCNAGCGEYKYCITEEKQRGCQLDERQFEHE